MELRRIGEEKHEFPESDSSFVISHWQLNLDDEELLKLFDLLSYNSQKPGKVDFNFVKVLHNLIANTKDFFFNRSRLEWLGKFKFASAQLLLLEEDPTKTIKTDTPPEMAVAAGLTETTQEESPQPDQKTLKPGDPCPFGCNDKLVFVCDNEEANRVFNREGLYLGRLFTCPKCVGFIVG